MHYLREILIQKSCVITATYYIFTTLYVAQVVSLFYVVYMYVGMGCYSRKGSTQYVHISMGLLFPHEVTVV
jgi:hypothetical protein